MVAGFLLLDLLKETRGLVFRVIQFREAVGDFTTGDEQLKAFSDLRIGVAAARQWRDFRRVVDDVGRIEQL